MILVLSDLWLPFPGGAERLLFNIARHLHRRGLPVFVLTGYAPAENPGDSDAPPVVAMPIGDGEGDPGWDVVRDVIREVAPTVIVTHHHYAHLFERQLVATGIPLVQVVLNGPRIPEARLAVFISQHVAEMSGSPREGDLLITPPAFSDVAAETHGDAIGFIKPIAHKGIDLLYRIAAELPDRQFVVLRGEWQNLEDIRDRPNVEFMEPVVDIRSFYERVRLMLVPSTTEDAGTVAQEATVNGLPCISSNVGGLAETNAGGILLAPHDLRTWVESIRALDDPEFYAAIVESQRDHLAATDHVGRLDVLADTIRGMA